MGSYSADWDSEDNIVRSVIAAPGAALGVFWNGRPNCHLTGMAIGRTVGACMREAMSTTGTSLLHTGYYPGMIH